MLAFLRGLGEPETPGSIGMDVCSPGELEWALEHGWLPQENSYTGTNVSDKDFATILRYPVQVNVDLLSQLERLGRLAPGRKVGIRITRAPAPRGRTCRSATRRTWTPSSASTPPRGPPSSASTPTSSTRRWR